LKLLWNDTLITNITACAAVVQAVVKADGQRGALKMREWKMQEWKLQEKTAGVEIAGVEEAGLDRTGRICRSGKQE